MHKVIIESNALPKVGAMMVVPGSSCPLCSAASTKLAAMRSSVDPPGFRNSHFASENVLLYSVAVITWYLQTSHSMPYSCGIFWSFTSGVPPIASRTVSRIFFCGSLNHSTISPS